MPAFWTWFIIILTVAFIAGCIWLISWSARQSPEDLADDAKMGHTWDGDLEELNNPAPRWWLNLFYLTIVFGVVYLVAYPGLGEYKGMLGWSQEGQYAEEMAAAESRYESVFQQFADLSIDELRGDDAALTVGKSLFANYCATCHGSDGRGAPGFPNLADADWLYGSDSAAIVASISNGRAGMMPPMGAALGGDAGIDAMVRYVRSLSDPTVDTTDLAASKALFQPMCGACHGQGGEGNPMLGAPNLTDSIWLYGGAAETIRTTIVNGRSGQMPAHGELLGEDKVRIVAAYVLSLSADTTAGN